MRKLKYYPRRHDCVPRSNPLTSAQLLGYLYMEQRYYLLQRGMVYVCVCLLVYSIKSYELILDWTLNGH